MREFVLLDSGPLGHACRRPGTPGADQYLLWIDALIARGVEVVVSEIADYEVRRPGPPRHFFLSFLRFSIVTNYCTCRLYLLVMTKATANIVKRCDDVPQKLRFSPNAGFAIRPSSPILMRWPWSSGPAVRIRDGSGRVVLTPRTGCPTEMGMFPENIAMLPGYAGPDPRDPCPEAESSTEVSSPHTRPAPFLFTV